MQVDKPINHGTIYAYTGRGCRCPECREASRVYSLKYRKTATGAVASRRSGARSNFIRQEALAWVREHHPEVIGELENRWEKEMLAPQNIDG